MALLDFLKPKNTMPAPMASILPEQIYKEGVLELQDVIAPSALKITPREINLGDKIARTFFVMSYPRVLTDSWFSPIINLDRVLDISIFIHPIDSAEILKKFQKKVAEVQSQIIGREEKGLVRTGVRVVKLGTEEVIELFYKLFNPGELEKPLQVTNLQSSK